MKPKDIDGYIATFPADVQASLARVRRAIRAAATQPCKMRLRNTPGPGGNLKFPYDEPLPLSLIGTHRAPQSQTRPRQGSKQETQVIETNADPSAPARPPTPATATSII